MTTLVAALRAVEAGHPAALRIAVDAIVVALDALRETIAVVADDEEATS
ncbi:MAG: hypothetical protein ACRELY_14475 [Polyangiaceae bacterium]